MSDMGDAVLDLFEDLYGGDTGGEAGYEVEYHKHNDSGGCKCGPVRAVKGRYGQFRVGTDEYAYSTHGQSDFIIVASELNDIGVSEPERLDTIDWEDDNGVRRVFRVGVDGVEHVWDWFGQFGNVYRVHTSEVV